MKRLIIKVGSAVLREKSKLSLERLDNLVTLIAKLKSTKEYEIILVSSGAVAAGSITLDLDKKNSLNRQVLSSIGQPLLMKHYKNSFSKYDIKCAQVLLVSQDFDSRARSINAKNVIEILLSNNIVPIINENDVVANDEIVFGDNDQLAAYSTDLFNAAGLIILSDIDGFYDKNPSENIDAKLIKEVNKIEDKYLQKPDNVYSEFGTGGIYTKLKSAHFLMQKNISMYLSTGFDLKYIKTLLMDKKHIGGTIFRSKNDLEVFK